MTEKISVPKNDMNVITDVQGGQTGVVLPDGRAMRVLFIEYQRVGDGMKLAQKLGYFVTDEQIDQMIGVLTDIKAGRLPGSEA